ncbi:MAG: ATP-binding cassette domain-containing protein [Lachnospiraceae bacterium]|jgi:ABC-type multidrug transport system, ATPase component|nr:ATP-binding cassette domain-containing protein [Lachnospiraceae bacterium]
MVKLEGVTKTFKKAVVVQEVTAEFRQGEITGIVGRNGSGKTVLFKMICGLLQPTAGKITVNGKQIGKDVDFPESIGVIIETPGFLPFQSGYRNLMEIAGINHKIRKEEVREAMRQVGLNPDSRKPVGKYSLGMRQRLGIAQAIMENPDVLVLDEPMNGLDETGVEEIRKLFLGLKESGRTLLIASHNKEDIEVLCDKVYRMDGGVLSNL